MTEKKVNTVKRRKKTKFTAEEKKFLVTRLNKIEGLVRSIREMVECNTYCPTILLRTKNMDASMKSFIREIVAIHVNDRVAKDIRQNNPNTTEELVEVLRHIMK